MHEDKWIFLFFPFFLCLSLLCGPTPTVLKRYIPLYNIILFTVELLFVIIYYSYFFYSVFLRLQLKW